MKRFKLRYPILGFILTYSITTLAFAVGDTSPSTEFVLLYKNEFTLLLCLITLILGTWLGVKLPSGVGEPGLSLSIKFVTSLLGGLLAFIYCLQKDKGLTLMNPFWIAAACVALPLTIMTLREKFLTYARSIKFPKSGE